jgi:hypothetical protein
MTMCSCGHPESDHKLRHACEELINYPSEEYPCSCERFVPSMAGDCLTCGHAKDKHQVILRCQPASGELCPCMKRIGRPT